MFVFQDSITGSSKDNFKSVKAAENLKKIYPGVVSLKIYLFKAPVHYYLKNNLFKNANGIVLSIPMPGHSVGGIWLIKSQLSLFYFNILFFKCEENVKFKVKNDVKQLEDLIKEHDCIFLLMDTRESRWLPTLIAAAEKK